MARATGASLLVVLAAESASACECTDSFAACPLWATPELCSQLQSFMHSECSLSCGICEPCAVHAADPCVAVPDDFRPGSIALTFARVASKHELAPTVLSEDPPVIMLDSFADAVEVEVIAREAEAVGFGASGSSCSFKAACNSSALSCVPIQGNHCWALPAMRELEARMLSTMEVPAKNCEPLRFFRYEQGETFQPHHDAAGQLIEPDTPGGPRVWSLYVFLNDVERGGEFRFPQLNISVAPKAGRAVLWPHLMDTDLQSPDERTEHEGAPVASGKKLGVNLHVHRSNLRTRVLAGCAIESEPPIQHTFPYERLAGSGPLHDVVGWHASDAVSQLLEAGASADAASADGTTPLHLASGRGLLEAVGSLLAAGAAVDAADGHGATALHHAARQGQAAAARLLIAAGATVEHSGASGMQPLHLAARLGQAEAVLALLDAGAAVDSRGGKSGLTALHLAARHGHATLARALISAGAAVGSSDKNEATPLHSAAAEGQASLVRMLLDEGGAAVDAAGGRGITALHLAAGLGKLEVVCLLRSKGARTSAQDAAGRKPVDYARRGNHPEVVRLLAGGHTAKEEL